jgi:hypothetical protein
MVNVTTGTEVEGTADSSMDVTGVSGMRWCSEDTKAVTCE